MKTTGLLDKKDRTRLHFILSKGLALVVVRKVYDDSFSLPMIVDWEISLDTVKPEKVMLIKWKHGSVLVWKHWISLLSFREWVIRPLPWNVEAKGRIRDAGYGEASVERKHFQGRTKAKRHWFPLYKKENCPFIFAFQRHVKEERQGEDDNPEMEWVCIFSLEIGIEKPFRIHTIAQLGIHLKRSRNEQCREFKINTSASGRKERVRDAKESEDSILLWEERPKLGPSLLSIDE